MPDRYAAACRIAGMLGVIASGVLVASASYGQPIFSVDYHGPTISQLDSLTGTAITEGDLLGFPPGAPPGIVRHGGQILPPGLGLPAHAGAVGHAPGTPGLVEVDALSYGRDDPIEATVLGFFVFSVDEFAAGLPGIPFPSVTTEGSGGSMEASADAFTNLPAAFPPQPLPPLAVPSFNAAISDGDGALPWGGPPTGLVEPNPPAAGTLDCGDNLDALEADFGDAGGVFPVFFSLDSSLVDLLEDSANSGSAVANGPFVGGDVLVVFSPGGPPVVYAAAATLGLDTLGPDSDDLDALVLAETGDGVFTPSAEPYDWTTGATDMLFFSVRRGSAIIGSPDLFFGVPIEAGDVLAPPPPGSPPGSPPGIWIAAENLGLATGRSGVALPFPPFGDDLNALDHFNDCNNDTIPDQIDISAGLSQDCNRNAIPDECDLSSGGSLDANGNGTPDECEFDPNPNFIRGDSDADGLLNALLDGLHVLRFQFSGGSRPPCFDAADSDDDGVVNGLLDGLHILSFGFVLGAPPPPPPFPACGEDPTGDAARCALHPCP